MAADTPTDAIAVLWAMGRYRVVLGEHVALDGTGGGGGGGPEKVAEALEALGGAWMAASVGRVDGPASASSRSSSLNPSQGQGTSGVQALTPPLLGWDQAALLATALADLEVQPEVSAESHTLSCTLLEFSTALCALRISCIKYEYWPVSCSALMVGSMAVERFISSRKITSSRHYNSNRHYNSRILLLYRCLRPPWVPAGGDMGEALGEGSGAPPSRGA